MDEDIYLGNIINNKLFIFNLKKNSELVCYAMYTVHIENFSQNQPWV